MSLSRILGTAVTGLTTNQTALRVTAANIANVNTEDYSRQVTNQESFVVNGESIGVKISGIERIVDRFLQAAGFDAKSRSFESDVQRQFHDRFQGIIGRPDSGTNIAARVSEFYDTLAELALNPAEQILRQATISSLQDLGDEISRIAKAIQNLRGEANQQIEEKIQFINDTLRRVHELNPLILRQRAVGGETGGLENQRDKALQDLAEVIDIRIAHTDSGIVSITTGSGTVLLDSALRELEYSASGLVTSENIFSPLQIYRLDPLSGERIGIGRDFDTDIGAGSLRGLIDLRDGDLRDLSLTLGEFASSFINEINAIHNSYSAVPPPNQLMSRPTQIDSGFPHNFTGVVTFGIVDSNNQLVQKSTIDFDSGPYPNMLSVANAVTTALGGAGTLTMAGGFLSFKATDPTHGVVIVDDAANPSRRGGQSLSQFFSMNDLLEASVRSNYDTGLKVTDLHDVSAGGTVTFALRDASGSTIKQYTLDPNAAGATYADILADLNSAGALGLYSTFGLDANGALTFTEKPGFEGARLIVTTDTTSMSGTAISFSSLFGIGDRYVADAAKGIQVVSSIREQPRNFALSAFDQTALIGETALSAGDQTGVAALQELDSKVVSFMAAGQLGDVNMALGQYAAAFLSNAGLMASRAAQRSEDNQALVNEIDVRIGSVSGVNLDEELSNMVILQNAYNASARIITTSSEMYDELLALVR